MITPRETNSIAKHFNEINKIRILSIAEQEELAMKASEGCLEARTSLITANLRLVPHLAKKYQVKGVLYEDLLAAGNEGLIYAADRYKLGNNFVSWANTCIKKYIILFLDKNTHTVRLSNFHKKEGLEPMNIKSFDDIIPGSDDLYFEDTLPGLMEEHEAYEDEDTNNHIREVLGKNIDKLTKYQAEVIKMLYYDGLTTREAADLTGKTYEVIRFLHGKAINKLKELLTTK